MSNIALLSNSTDTVIDCQNGNVGFHFSNPTNITIASIAFINCGGPLPNYTASATLSAVNSSGLNLTKTTITNSTGHGFLIEYFGTVYIRKSHFERNFEVNKTHKQGNVLKCSNHNSFLSIEDSELVNFNGTGLEVILHCDNSYSHFKNFTLRGNKASNSYGGNMGINVIYSYKTQIYIEDSNFESGSAKAGGGLSIQINDYAIRNTSHLCNAENHSSIVVVNSNFTGNVADEGGGVYIKKLEPTTYCKNRILFHKCNFEANSINQSVYGGVALHSIVFETVGYSKQSYPQLGAALNIAECNFFSNIIVQRLQTDISIGGTVLLQADTNVAIANSTIENNYCSGIVIINSNVILEGNVTIANNSGSAGGGMFLGQYAKLYMRPHTTVTIAHNRALYAGGGIYVADNDNAEIQSPCFFQFHFDIEDLPLVNTTRVHLTNNTALFAGHQLYGGSVSFCYLITSDDAVHNQQKYYNSVFHYDNPHQPSYISSNPERICYCTNHNRVHCKLSWTESRYPGERFAISVAVVGQKSGIRPGGVTAEVTGRKSSHNAALDELQNIQSINNSCCANLQYTIYSNAEWVLLVLQAEQPGDSSMINYITKYRPLIIEIKLMNCPLGFQKIERPSFGYHCDCVSLLWRRNIICNITQRTIQRQDPMWIGYTDYQDGNGNHTSVVFHSTCPKDYCKPGAINITCSNETLDQDEQCAFNRTGIMCGSCEGNLSAVFGSSNCLECTNLSLFLILAFAFAGILLVVVLFALNLTVAEGTIHGLLFYANIVQVNADTFFPSEHATVYLGILKTFIAWINLDLGIETCFYNGMNALAKALLQFAFPLYIWSISGAIVFLSSRSYRMSRLIGNNAVKVLATLILLSFTKLLRAVLNGLAFATLEFDDTNVSFKDRAVWELDGNVPFTDKKYLLLFVTALAFCLIMLPFTLTLLFIQPLQRHSHRRLCCHIRRLMPFFDAYTGAYKHRNRFWPGLLLSTRVILLILHALNLSSDPKLNMMGITLATIILLLIAWLTRQGIYRKLYADILEALSIINLGMLCSVTAYNLGAGIHTRKSQTLETSISASIALLTFIGIVCCHASKQVMRTRCWKRLTVRVRELRRPVNADIDVDGDIANYPPFRRFDEDREPLLGQAE